MTEHIDISLRRAEARDAKAVTDLVVTAFDQYTPLIGKPPAPALFDYVELIATGRVRVAMSGEEILGVIYTYREDDGAVMMDVLAVSEAAQGRGVAKCLIAEAEELARAERSHLMRVYTNAVMLGPQAIYPRLGYVETHRGESDGYQRIHYEKAF